jgi:hypothetical protein
MGIYCVFECIIFNFTYVVSLSVLYLILLNRLSVFFPMLGVLAVGHTANLKPKYKGDYIEIILMCVICIFFYSDYLAILTQTTATLPIICYSTQRIRCNE